MLQVRLQSNCCVSLAWSCHFDPDGEIHRSVRGRASDWHQPRQRSPTLIQPGGAFVVGHLDTMQQGFRVSQLLFRHRLLAALVEETLPLGSLECRPNRMYACTNTHCPTTGHCAPPRSAGGSVVRPLAGQLNIKPAYSRKQSYALRATPGVGIDHTGQAGRCGGLPRQVRECELYCRGSQLERAHRLTSARKAGVRKEDECCLVDSICQGNMEWQRSMQACCRMG